MASSPDFKHGLVNDDLSQTSIIIAKRLQFLRAALSLVVFASVLVIPFMWVVLSADNNWVPKTILMRNDKKEEVAGCEALMVEHGNCPEPLSGHDSKKCQWIPGGKVESSPSDTGAPTVDPSSAESGPPTPSAGVAPAPTSGVAPAPSAGVDAAPSGDPDEQADSDDSKEGIDSEDSKEGIDCEGTFKEFAGVDVTLKHSGLIFYPFAIGCAVEMFMMLAVVMSLSAPNAPGMRIVWISEVVATLVWIGLWVMLISVHRTLRGLSQGEYRNWQGTTLSVALYFFGFVSIVLRLIAAYCFRQLGQRCTACKGNTNAVMRELNAQLETWEDAWQAGKKGNAPEKRNFEKDVAATTKKVWGGGNKVVELAQPCIIKAPKAEEDGDNDSEDDSESLPCMPASNILVDEIDMRRKKRTVRRMA